jgi:septum formation protein
MAKALPFRLILASGSAARKDLLTRAGYSFTVQPAHVDEPSGGGVTDPRAFVENVAWSKAAAAGAKVDEGVVLAADTVGWLDGAVIGKPANEADARRILRTLAGREHELWTGVCLWRRPDDVQIAWQEMTRVAFQPISDEELTAYLATRQWQGCSGAYAIQESGDPHVQVVAGSLTNVIGLPMETLEKVLKKLAGIESVV